jgi:26S proteasome regulatory subunit N7
MSSMAASFGMTLPLLDMELSRFIAAGRISAKIDKVGDIVETSRPDKKNAQFSEIIKKGDILLNHVQKLVRTIEQ